LNLRYRVRKKWLFYHPSAGEGLSEVATTSLGCLTAMRTRRHLDLRKIVQYNNGL